MRLEDAKEMLNKLGVEDLIDKYTPVHCVLFKIVTVLIERIETLESEKEVEPTDNLRSIKDYYERIENIHYKKLCEVVGSDDVAAKWYHNLRLYQPHSNTTLDHLLIVVTQQLYKGYCTYEDVRNMSEYFPAMCVPCLKSNYLKGSNETAPNFMTLLLIDLEVMNEN